MRASRPARPRNTSSHEPMARGHPVSMRLLDNALSAGKQDMPRGGTENNIAINTTRRTTGRIKFCFIHHVQCLTRTIKTNGSEHSDLSMDDVTQLFPQLSVGRRCWWQHLMGGLGPLLCHTFPDCALRGLMQALFASSRREKRLDMNRPLTNG